MYVFAHHPIHVGCIGVQEKAGLLAHASYIYYTSPKILVASSSKLASTVAGPHRHLNRFPFCILPSSGKNLYFNVMKLYTLFIIAELYKNVRTIQISFLITIVIF